MFIGMVIGSVWATQKETGMDQIKLLIVQPIDWKGVENGNTIIAADRIGAGVGERVIISRGSPARYVFGQTSPVDAVVVGIVDSFEIAEDV
jgi:ethanolamine utilization protein EutN